MIASFVADFGTRAFWLGSVCTFGYIILLTVLVLLWWLYRDADKPAEPLSRVEREFLAIVGRARR